MQQNRLGSFLIWSLILRRFLEVQKSKRNCSDPATTSRRKNLSQKLLFLKKKNRHNRENCLHRKKWSMNSKEKPSISERLSLNRQPASWKPWIRSYLNRVRLKSTLLNYPSINQKKSQKIILKNRKNNKIPNQLICLIWGLSSPIQEPQRVRRRGTNQLSQFILIIEWSFKLKSHSFRFTLEIFFFWSILFDLLAAGC